MRGETLLRGRSATDGYPGGNGNGDADSDGGSTPDGTVDDTSPSGAAAGAEDPTVDVWLGGGSWEDLAAPAARLWAACRPSGPAELEALDEVLGGVFRRGVARHGPG